MNRTWTSAELLSLYGSMLRMRRFEETASQKYKNGDIPGFVHLYIGEEAVAAGILAQLGPQDVVTSTHRGHGHALGKGVSSREAMAELFGRQGGCSGGRGGSMHMYKKSAGFLGTNGMVGGGIGLATGAGFALKNQQKDAVAVCFFGDGASNMGILYESLNLAALYRLPVIYVCENNLYATCVANEDVAANPNVASRAQAFNMPGMQVDGNDVQTVYEAFAQALARAKRGEGPTLLEARTYRHHGHHEGDQLYGTYRTREEVDTYVALRDPLKNFRQKLLLVYGVSGDELSAIEEAIEAEILDAVEFAAQSPLPDIKTLGRFIFQEAAL